MTVLALWSAPRSRSTAFFRSMLERGDLLALHEPLEGLHFVGPIDVAGRRFETPESLMEWLLDDTAGVVFFKETITTPILRLVHADRRFLTEVRHTFLIRTPEEIAASWLAIDTDMRIQETGLEALHGLYVAVRNAQGAPPIVIDSDDLLAQPAATMRAYCAAVGLPFLERALAWDADTGAQWARAVRWHTDAMVSTGFASPTKPDRYSLETHPDVLRFAEHHRPFYEELYAARLRIKPAEDG